MIVRIQTEGQWELSDAQVKELDAIDDRLAEAVNKADHEHFHPLLQQLLSYVRDHGRALKPEEIAESELILPPGDATMDEVRELLSSEGFVIG